MPSRVELRADDLSRLAGTWRGYYRNPSAINIPLTASATERGDLDCQEGDPVNNRYRGAFAISDGAVSTTLGRENGTLHLHEGGGKRVLVGDIMVRTVAYPVRLESDLAIAVPAAKSASLPSDLKIVPPSPSVPPQLAALSGKWFGRMDNKRDLTMVFEKVEESGGVTVISTEKIGWIRVRVRASFVGPGLEFDSAPYTTPSINLRSRVQEDGSLAVCLSVAGVVVGRGRLARQPD